MSAVPDDGAQDRTEIGDTDNAHPSSFLLTGSSNESLHSCFPAAETVTKCRSNQRCLEALLEILGPPNLKTRHYVLSVCIRHRHDAVQ